MYILEGNVVIPHKSLNQWCCDDLKKAYPLIRIYHEESWGYRGPNSHSFYEIFKYFIVFSKINFVNKITGMQYL